MTDPAAAPTPLRVLVVDPDDCIRDSLTGLLEIGDRCLVVGSAGTAEAAIRLAGDRVPDVIVVDPRPPGSDAGADLIAGLRRACLTTRILVLEWSLAGDGAGDHEEQASGADAYTRKTFRSQELIDAVVAASGRSAT